MKKKGLLAVFITMALPCMAASSAWAGTWVEDGANWKYYSDNGNLVTGWIEDNDNWYYLSGSGNMATGWIKVEGSWYYLHDDGTMAHDTWVDNYYVNSKGKWVKTR